MVPLIGASLGAWIGLTVVVLGIAAFLSGQMTAQHWRPRSHAVMYAALLAVASRFLHFALFKGALLSLSGFFADLLVLEAIALFAHRATWVAKMLDQYPWLYERDGLLGLREK
ncbi:MAG: hypothetical protein FJX47_17125 [Alphaproteobacteria bacterium]|nr:hypothetical protein [Alphaproteobacteria bacterium]